MVQFFITTVHLFIEQINQDSYLEVHSARALSEQRVKSADKARAPDILEK